MAAVSRDTIRANCFTNVRTLLTSVTSNTYAAYPLTNITLPLLVIENPTIPSHENGLQSELTSEVSVLVTIYAKYASSIDYYSDLIDKTIRDARYTFSTDGMYLTNIIDNGTIAYEGLNDNRNFSKTLTVLWLVG